VLELGCGSAGVVSGLLAETVLQPAARAAQPEDDGSNFLRNFGTNPLHSCYTIYHNMVSS